MELRRRPRARAGRKSWGRIFGRCMVEEGFVIESTVMLEDAGTPRPRESRRYPDVAQCPPSTYSTSSFRQLPLCIVYLHPISISIPFPVFVTAMNNPAVTNLVLSLGAMQGTSHLELRRATAHTIQSPEGSPWTTLKS